MGKDSIVAPETDKEYITIAIISLVIGACCCVSLGFVLMACLAFKRQVYNIRKEQNETRHGLDENVNMNNNKLSRQNHPEGTNQNNAITINLRQNANLTVINEQKQYIE